MKPMSKGVKQHRWKTNGPRQDQKSNSNVAMGARGKKRKKRKTKNHLKANGRKGKGRSRMAIVGGCEDHCE